MNKLAIKIVLINNLHTQRDLTRLKVEAFFYILENDYSFSITDILSFKNLLNVLEMTNIYLFKNIY